MLALPAYLWQTARCCAGTAAGVQNPYSFARLPDDTLLLWVVTVLVHDPTAFINGKFTVTELFKTNECGSQIQQPILFENHLYLNSNSNEREDGMMCLTLDGVVKWKTRESRFSWFSDTFERGPLLLADGLIFNLDGKKGILHLIQPSPEEFKELAQVKILGGKQIWSPMALSQGKLVLRSQSEMKCLDVKNP